MERSTRGRGHHLDHDLAAHGTGAIGETIASRVKAMEKLAVVVV